jgi:hypothetical protein
VTKSMWIGMALGSVLCASTATYAGKPERDKAAELKPQLAADEKAIAASCGCPVALDVKWDSYAAADHMARIGYDADEFAAAAKHQCQSDDDKKAFCKGVKTLHVEYMSSSIGAPELKGTTITSHSNNTSYNGASQFKQILDKL